MAAVRRPPTLRLGAPGSYVLAAWVGTVLWFPVRWHEAPDGPLALTAVRAVFFGLFLVGLVTVAVRTLTRVRRVRRGLPEPAPPAGAADPTGV